MPSSPSRSPSKSPKGGYSSQNTKRSSVSKAFDNNLVTKDPNATASVGTMADPSATAPDILASGPNIKINMKSPSTMTAKGASSVASSATSKGGSSVSGAASKAPAPAPASGFGSSVVGPSKLPGVSVATTGLGSTAPTTRSAVGASKMPPSKAPSSPGASNVGSGVASATKVPSAASQTGPGSNSVGKPASGVLGQSQEAQTLGTQDGAQGQPPLPPPTQPLLNADGLITIGTRRGALIELILAIIGLLFFTAIFVYFISGKCNNIFLNKVDGYVESSYVFIGMITCVFLIFHSCFEKGFQAGRGVFGCIVFFLVSGAVVINLWGSFRLAYSCVCSCHQGTESAFHSGAKAENVILFLMDLAGCICLIMILLIASVSHD